MANQEKVDAVDKIAKSLEDSSAAVLTNYRGLKVSEMHALRRVLGAETTYTVVKNTLTRRAVAKAGLDELTEHLQGPTAIAFIKGDAAVAAKGLRDFAKDNPLLEIKAGVFEGRAVSADEVKQIADLEPREVLLAKLAGAMKGNLTKAVGTFAAPLSQFARLAEALKAKKPADVAAPAEAAADAPAPAAEVPSTEESTEASES
ncbi:LSU ribosomal protein L10P [Antricoccus suffuscus]|uniref:Large ribosomal subunit protein uL10 n=1 Tax=Antricoccus suffuscus TaxID=1629062 RepID=A0A2T0ZX88_9ACTN|nr:50S ribosomal protein L10 [Antricoccus suffuscus]PRZ40972.1 LSU ribosomal protein L10P [Antricoccus suffuscus]